MYARNESPMSVDIPDEFQQYEKKIYDQRQLIEISRALNSTLDYQYLINAVLDICLAQVQTLQAALFLTPDMDADHLNLIGDTKGFDLNRPESEYRIPVDSPLIRYFEETNRALSFDKIEEKISNCSSIDTLREMGAELIVPMRAKGKIIGVIVLGERAVGGSYGDGEKNFLVDLASLGGIAVDNARLYERATVDMMTSLKNHAYLQTRLREEREKALRRKTSLAFILTDVDKFKVFNDTYGHQAGDEVLRAVAKVLMQTARPTDVSARYGGEEFCMIVPNADVDKALELAETFRRSVEENTVHHEGKELRVTVSVGVSIFDPEVDIRTNKTLIERADLALYACKDAGRNKVLAFDPSMKNS